MNQIQIALACFSRVALVNKSALKAIKRINNVDGEFSRFDIRPLLRIAQNSTRAHTFFIKSINMVSRLLQLKQHFLISKTDFMSFKFDVTLYLCV